MCGISGTFNSKKVSDAKLISQMMNVQAHRGPSDYNGLIN